MLPFTTETSITDYNRLRRCYLSNRVVDCCDPETAYERAVVSWALKSKQNRHEHCQSLLKAVANPMMLESSLCELRSKLRLTRDEQEWLCGDPSHKWVWLRGVQDELLHKNFAAGKFQKYKIPKPGKCGFRTIEVPDTKTRIVAKTILKVLNPLLDPDFYPLSVGFRPNRSALHGIAAADHLQRRGMNHWVQCDIRDAFGQVPKPTLLDVIGSRLHGSPAMWLVEEVLGKNRKRGIPQGVALSPLAMNCYLDHFIDKWWLKRSPETCLLRYADDLLIACPTRQSAIESFDALQQRAVTIGMPLKESRSDAVLDLSGGDVVHWLGFQIKLESDKLVYSLGQKSWDSFRCKLQEVMLRQQFGESYEAGEIKSIGFSRVVQKAIAVGKHEVHEIAERMRETSAEYGLDMSGFTEDEARKAWSIGRSKWEEAREDVIPWLPTT